MEGSGSVSLDTNDECKIDDEISDGIKYLTRLGSNLFVFILSTY